MKKGYKAEWEAKKILFKKYSPDSVFKVAIGGAVDFFILGKNGKVKKIVEVKKTNKNWWYPLDHDKRQYNQLRKIQRKFKIPVEYWIRINGNWKILDLKEVKKFFC
jgi:LysM repeat protein